MFDQGWYKCRGFRVQAWSFEEAYHKLNDQWEEKQRRDQEVKNLGKRRQAERLHLVNLDDKHRNTALEHLKHPNYKQVFVGRFSVHGGRVTFVEEGTWISVSVDAPSQAKSMHGADVPKARGKQLYVALRAAHSKNHAKAEGAQRQSKLQSQIPKQPGDMAVKASRDDGRLVYTWNTASPLQGNTGELFEVNVTPRRHRPALEADASGWAQTRARETTPDRALRKMREKIKRSLDKAARGEHERIVAVCERAPGNNDSAAPSTERAGAASHCADAGATVSSAPVDATLHCPALSQLDRPEVLSHLRAAYEFLDTC